MKCPFCHKKNTLHLKKVLFTNPYGEESWLHYYCDSCKQMSSALSYKIEHLTTTQIDVS